MQIPAVKAVPFDRHMPHFINDPSADRDRVRLLVNIQPLQELLHIGGAHYHILPVGDRLDFLHHFVVLIPDFPHQLFQNILHGDNTDRASKFVQNYGDMGFLLLQIL